MSSSQEGAKASEMLLKSIARLLSKIFKVNFGFGGDSEPGDMKDVISYLKEKRDASVKGGDFSGAYILETQRIALDEYQKGVDKLTELQAGGKEIMKQDIDAVMNDVGTNIQNKLESLDMSDDVVALKKDYKLQDADLINSKVSMLNSSLSEKITEITGEKPDRDLLAVINQSTAVAKSNISVLPATPAEEAGIKPSMSNENQITQDMERARERERDRERGRGKNFSEWDGPGM